jgi:hypothetical protein
MLWDLEPLANLHDHALNRACDFAGGGLDEQEWSRYVPNITYERPARADSLFLVTIPVNPARRSKSGVFTHYLRGLLRRVGPH